MEKLITKIEQSPYGDTGATYEGVLGMFNHFLLQLKSFRPGQKTKEASDYLEADIRGYEEILKSNSEENANQFMIVKQAGRMGKGPSFANNEKIVQHLKESGKWI